MNTNNLFIQTPQFEKVAYKRVSENPSEWIANIMEAFYNQFPSFSNSKVSVNLTQKDEAKGYAIGNITVEEGTGMVVPIVIKDRELFPFDVAIVNGNAMPLTNATIQMYIENRGAFWKLVRPDAGDVTNALFNTSFSQSITPTYMHETYKQAEYNHEETFEEEAMRTGLKQRLITIPAAADTNNVKALTGDIRGEGKLVQDEMLKKMYETALVGGQMKVNETFMQLYKDWEVRRTDSLMYMMLTFKDWARRQGYKTSGLDIPGFAKHAGVADWFFDEDVDFLAKHTGLTHTKLNEAKKKDKDRFSALYSAAKKAKDSGGDVRAAIAISMKQPQSMESGPQSLTDKTQSEAMKVSQNVEPALGVTAMSKKGGCKTPEEAVAKQRLLVQKQGPELKTNIDEQYTVTEFISKISSTITSEMKDSFFDVLQKDASIVEGFKVNGTAGLVLKLAAVNPQPINFTEKVRQELERDIHYIYKSGSHEYTGIFGNARIDDPVRITLTADSAQKIEPIKTAEVIEVPTEFEKFASAKYAFAADGHKYAVLTNNNYIEFTLGQDIPIDENGMFKFAETSLDIVEPTITKNAMWRIDGKFTAPFEVLRVWNENGKERIETYEGLEKKAYCRMQGIDTRYEEKGIIYLPAHTQFIKLGEKIEVPEKLLDNPMLNNEILKTAANQYNLRGRIFTEHLKKEGTYQDIHGASWHMIQCGAHKEDIEKLASMQVGDILPLKYNLRIPHSLDKIAAIMENRYVHDADIIIDVAKHFIKEAAAFNDPQTVDMVLSLNFVNKNNILEFVEALPMFAQVTQKLSDMLLKARLGVTLVEESAIRRTMLGLVEIMDVLNGVQNLLEKK